MHTTALCPTIQHTKPPRIQYEVDVCFHDKQITTSMTGHFKDPAAAAFAAMDLIQYARDSAEANFDNISIFIKRARP